MARRRLTNETLETIGQRDASLQAADISARLLGKGATDSELVAAGSLLYKALGPTGVRKIHRMASTVMAETGEKWGTEDFDVPQEDPSDTQSYVSQVEAPPNQSVLPVAMHSEHPPKRVQEPKGVKIGGKRRAAEEDEDEDLDLEDEDTDDADMDDDFDDMDEDEDDDGGREAASDDDDDDDEDDDTDDEDNDAEIEDELGDDNMDVDAMESMGGMDSVGAPEGPIDFEPAGQAYQEGIDQEGYYEEEQDQMDNGTENRDFDEQDVRRLKDHLGLHDLGGAEEHAGGKAPGGMADMGDMSDLVGMPTAARKKGQKQKQATFRPDRRRRTASSQETQSEFDSVFGVPDVSDEFAQ
jgi:hypothetical protein